MRRRGFIALLGGGVAPSGSLPGTARAQAVQVRRVGILAPGPLTPIERLKDRLRELGWVAGKNIQFEERWGGDDDLRYPKLAQELVATRST